jgi:hypothetical protein
MCATATPNGKLSEFILESNDVPRRSRLDLCTPTELSITEAMQQVENMGADIMLTEAVNLLQKARDLVSDYVDKNPELLADFT